MALDVDEMVSMALFARVVQEQSFTAAAAAAGLTKSAVSRRVAQLEARLGVRLLRRSTRRLALTDEGAVFYAHCAQMLDAARAAEAAVAGASERLEGVVHVNAPVSFARMYLADALATFLRARPEVEVRLTTDDRFVDVVAGGYDLVVRVGRLSSPGLVARKLAADRLVVCASPEYLAREGTPRTPADLARHNGLHYGLVSRAGEWRFRGEGGEAYTVPVRGNFVCTDGGVLAAAARAGLGLAVVPYFLVAGDVAAGRLELLLEGQRRAEIGVYAVTAHGTQLPARVRALIEHLARHFAVPPWGAAAGRQGARPVAPGGGRAPG